MCLTQHGDTHDLHYMQYILLYYTEQIHIFISFNQFMLNYTGYSHGCRTDYENPSRCR